MNVDASTTNQYIHIAAKFTDRAEIAAAKRLFPIGHAEEKPREICEILTSLKASVHTDSYGQQHHS